jgi:hypothetical protein
VNCFFRVYYLPPTAAKGKRNLWGHPTPRQRAAPSALLFRTLPAAAKWERGVFRGHSNPGKGHCPLHSCFICCLRRRNGKEEFFGDTRTPARDVVLCTPVSYVACGGERKKEFFGDPLLHPPDARPRTPAKDVVLCTPIRIYAFLKVQVTLPKESLSPSLTGSALSGSRRLPLMRVEFVLFRSVTV